MSDTTKTSGDIMSADHAGSARARDRAAEEGLLDGDRDGDELHRQLGQPGWRARAGDQGVPQRTDIQEELGHAQQFAERIKTLYGVVPGSLEFAAEQTYLQPPDDQIDIVHVIKGVIEAEQGAIEYYSHVIKETEEIDPVTNDMVIAILQDEQGHKRLFEGLPPRVRKGRARVELPKAAPPPRARLRRRG